MKKLDLEVNNFKAFLNKLGHILFAKDFLISFAIIVFLFIFAHSFMSILAPFLVALILAYILNPAVLWVIRVLKLSRDYAVILIFFCLLFASTAFLMPLTLQLASGINSMASEILKIEYGPLLKQFRQDLLAYREELPVPIANFLAVPFDSLKNYEDSLNQMISSVRDFAGKSLKYVGSSLISFSNMAIKRTMDIFLIPILLFYMLLDYEKIYPLLVKVMPVGYRAWLVAFIKKSDNTLRKFIFSQFLVASIYGCLMTVGLLLIGIKFSLVIGPLSGIANLIPYLGVIFSLGPVLGLAIYQGATSGQLLWFLSLVCIHYIIVQLIDGFILQPKIIGENVQLHPLVVMLALFIGGEIGGIYGMIFAVPVTAILKVLTLELYSILYENKSLLLNGENVDDN